MKDIIYFPNMVAPYLNSPAGMMLNPDHSSYAGHLPVQTVTSSDPARSLRGGN